MFKDSKSPGQTSGCGPENNLQEKSASCCDRMTPFTEWLQEETLLHTHTHGFIGFRAKANSLQKAVPCSELSIRNGARAGRKGLGGKVGVKRRSDT